MAFSREGWQTDPIKAGACLWQAITAAAIGFRWILQACLDLVHKQWCAAGVGFFIDHEVMTHLAQSSDTWIVIEFPLGLDTMLADLSFHAEETTALEIRREQCKLAVEDPMASAEEAIDSTRMPLLTSLVGSRRRVPQPLRSKTSQIGSGRHPSERAGMPCHMQPRLLGIRGNAKDKTHVLRMSVWSVVNRVARNRYWARQELSSVCSMRRHMRRRP